jgi:osmoprotectant transport system substrate-binding protein
MDQANILCNRCNIPVPSNADFCTTCGQIIKLHKRYYINEEIATWKVFKANDIVRSNKEVIVKRFAPTSTNRYDLQTAEEQCKHEAEILNSLNHHCIPDAYEYFSERDVWYLIMKFMEGETLEVRWQRARKKTRLSAEEILSIGDELCSLLEYLHQRSIIFVDLKPSNIILGNDQHINLIDFGSAYDLKARKNQSIKWKVTSGYSAPELEQGRKPSTRSDIYSLGATLFQLASGEKPSSNPLTADILDTRKLSGTPSELVQLIAQMMQEDEHNRPQSMTEVQKELQSIKQKLQVPAPSSQTRSTGRRNFLLGSLAGVVASCLVGGPAIWFTSPHKNSIHKNSIQFPLTVGGKLDNESSLLTEMYLLLLQNDGFLMTDRSLLGQNAQVFGAMQTGSIDIYPEFLLTGLARLGIPTTHNQQTDFQNVKDAFFTQYQMTWLDQAIKLNDNFCVTMPANNATQLKIKTLSNLASSMQNHSASFIIAVAPDYQETLHSLHTTYGITFPADNVLQEAEEETFHAVNEDLAQLSICDSTDPLITKNNFVRLIDDKGALPIDTPSPVVRNEVLNKEPRIAKTLQPLAHLLSIEVSVSLQQQVLNGQSPRDVAAQWLQTQGLL